MKVKNLNFIERHVEKITLGVAAAGGLWLLWMALQPATIEQNGTLVTPEGVEKAVTAAVEDLEKARQDTARIPDSKLMGPGSMKNWVEEYLAIQNTPLPRAVVTAPVPQFGPLNAPVVPGTIKDPRRPELTVNPPKMPALVDVKAKAERGVVSVPPAGAPAAGPGGPVVAGVPQDLNWVVIGGRFPVIDFRESMANKGGKLEEAVPPEVQRLTFYKVEVERQEKAGGVWGKWQPVAPSAGSGPEISLNLKGLPGEAVLKSLDALDTQWKNVLMPGFYTTAKGEAVQPLVMPENLDAKSKLEMQKRLDELNRVGTTGRPGPVAPGFVPGGGTVDGEGLSRPAGAGASAPPIGVPADLETVRHHSATVPFWFFDDSVKPEQSYRYRARLKIFNPVFQLDKQAKLATNEKLRDEPWLTSDWAQVFNVDANPKAPDDARLEVAINANQYIFFRAALGADRGVNARVFKWSLGSWYVYEETVYPGQTIGGVKRLFNQDIDFSTGYTLVDAVKAGDDTALVLLTPSKELVLRSAKADGANPKQRELEPLVVKKAVAAKGAGGSEVVDDTTSKANPARNPLER